MQVGFTEKDRTILAVAASGSGGTISEVSMYSKIAEKLGLDGLDIEKKTEELDGDDIENFELERREVKLLCEIMGRGSSWSFSKGGRQAIEGLYNRLRKITED